MIELLVCGNEIHCWVVSLLHNDGDGCACCGVGVHS